MACSFKLLLVGATGAVGQAQRERSRPAEHLGVLLARALKPVIPKKHRLVTPRQIADALLRGALSGEAGVHVVESDAL